MHRILRLAEAHDTLIVEDDIYADFEAEPGPRLAGFDGLERVIHIGGFSKTLSAAARIGVIAIRSDWVERLVDLKLAVCLSNSHLSAALIHRFLADGSYRHHLESVRTRLADSRGTTLKRLVAAGLSVPFVPTAGMFLWARLPYGLDAAEVSRRALAKGVVLAPGNVFSLGQNAADHLRFNVAQCADKRVFDVLEAAMGDEAGANSALHERRKIRPLFDTEGPYVAHRGRKPGQRLQRRNCREQLGQVFVAADVEAALDPVEAMPRESRTDVSVSLRDASRMILLRIDHRQIERDGEHQPSRGSSRRSCRR